MDGAAWGRPEYFEDAGALRPNQFHHRRRQERGPAGRRGRLVQPVPGKFCFAEVNKIRGGSNMKKRLYVGLFFVASSAAAVDWPRVKETEDSKYTIYQPQLESWDYTTLKAQSAVSVQPKN